VTAFRLPVSGFTVSLRPPTGAEDLLLAESPAGDLTTALALTRRLASPAEGTSWSFEDLCVTDLDALVLHVRQVVLGDRILAELRCPARHCGRPFDLSFDVRAYLAHEPSRADPEVVPDEEPGWFRLRDDAARFRLPSAADVVAIAGSTDPYAELCRRCILPVDAPAPVRERVEAAMETIAPSLARELEGECPECGALVSVFFEPVVYCLRELRNRASFIYEDVDLLARRYHWSEPQILAMPQSRRIRYVELARDE
jgi:hypothetical protein